MNHNTDLNVQDFGLLQGIKSEDQFVLNKQYKGQKRKYSDWYDIVKKDFEIGEKKNFQNK